MLYGFSPSDLRRLVYVSTHVFILASSIPTEVCPSECSSSSSSSSCPGSPDRGSSRGTRAVQVEIALSSSSNARYRGTWRAISRTAERQEGHKVFNGVLWRPVPSQFLHYLVWFLEDTFLGQRKSRFLLLCTRKMFFSNLKGQLRKPLMTVIFNIRLTTKFKNFSVAERSSGS